MDEFVIQGPSGLESLRFFDRDPGDRTRPIESFRACLMSLGLSATIRVWAGYTYSQPAPLFVDMARQWDGWIGDLVWSSLEGEMHLRCTRDKLGHIAICVGMRSGFMPEDWRVEATVFTEAGQLERIALHAITFFGS